jgi:hypothetical protein
MNPKPFVVLNHLTVPVAITASLLQSMPKQQRKGGSTTGPYGRLEGTPQKTGFSGPETPRKGTAAQQGKPKYDCTH